MRAASLVAGASNYAFLICPVRASLFRLLSLLHCEICQLAAALLVCGHVLVREPVPRQQASLTETGRPIDINSVRLVPALWKGITLSSSLCRSGSDYQTAVTAEEHSLQPGEKERTQKWQGVDAQGCLIYRTRDSLKGC